MKFREEYHFEDEADRAWRERLVRQVQDHAPTCLSGFQARFLPPSDLTWDDRTNWELVCSCGGKQGRILGYPRRDFETDGGEPDNDGPEFFCTPLGFDCSSCGKTTEIIDTDLHGHDGECKTRYGDYGATCCRGTGPRSVFACHECGGAQFTVTAYFQYSHFDHIQDEGELESEAQDFFDWFECRGACFSCGKEQSLGDYELA